MLTHHISAQLLRIHAVVLLVLIATMLSPLSTSAQGAAFVADTLVPPYLFDLRADGVLLDFSIDSSSAICFIGRHDGLGISYDYVVRRNVYTARLDTLYEASSPPSANSFYLFDAKGQSITLGVSDDRYLVTSDDAGRSWIAIDIGDTASYRNIGIVKPGIWLLKSSRPLTGWRYVTHDTAYWFYHKKSTNSWIRLLDDSLLLFVADDECRGADDLDTGYFQVLRIGELFDELTPVLVPTAPFPPLPSGSVCPRLNFIGSDGERLWFRREWGISYPDTQTNAFPTALYSYDFKTGTVQYEYFIRHPRWPLRAILFAEHIFIALDSQLVFRHINAPPSTPFAVVEGVEVGLGDLQVHEGSLYGSRSSGLIMRISQVSSVPTSDVENSGLFTTEIQGGEIAVFADSGPTSNDVRLELFDTQGRRLAESSIASGSRVGRLPVPLAPGVYFLRCRGSEISTTLRIFVP